MDCPHHRGRRGRTRAGRPCGYGGAQTILDFGKRCAEALRKRGVEDVRGTKRIVLEASGEITVVKANA
jgi:hypothetical protein